MANRLYNKQVSPKGYQKGGRVAKMGGGMMMKRPMMNSGGPISFIKKKLKERKRKKSEEEKVRKLKEGLMVEKLKEGLKEQTKKDSKKFRDGGSALKPVNPETQKGLSKLPKKVRNKMGYMKKGGKV